MIYIKGIIGNKLKVHIYSKNSILGFNLNQRTKIIETSKILRKKISFNITSVSILFQLVPNNVTIEPLPEYSVTLQELNEWTRKHFDYTIQVIKKKC